MMYDLFFNVAYGCGIVLFLLITLIVLKWSWCYLFDRQKVNFEPPRPVQIFPTPKLAQKVVAVDLPETKVTAPTAKMEGEPEPFSKSEFLIECGNCGREIKSPKIGQHIEPETGVTGTIYECEHCHSRVAVPD